MRIASSDITLASSQISLKTSSVSEHLRIWDKASDVTTDSHKDGSAATQSSYVKNTSIKAAGTSIGPAAVLTLTPQPVDPLVEINKEFFVSVKEQIMKDMIEMITGRKITLLDPSSMRQSNTSSDAAGGQPDAQSAQDGQGPGQKMQGWGVDYSYKETQTTKEGVAVSASGTVTTADGRTISFTASMEMTRETSEETTVSFKAGDALIDPLMVDTTGKGVQLSGASFNFDLNSDGVKELIAAPAAGTGFLAYDKNGNGIIDSGTELFGPRSGNGFSDLSKLDEDKNGWIDENDSAFNKLSVWQKAPDGSDSLSSLKDSGIGAIYLGHAASRFDLTDPNNPQTQSAAVAGVLRETGMFMRESGQTGLVQEIDLVA